MTEVHTLTKQVKRLPRVVYTLLRMSFFILATILIFASCKKELKAPTPAPFDAGVLSASKDTVVLDAGNPAVEAVKFAWTADKNSLIAYKLILTANDISDTIDIPQNAVSKPFTNSEFNAILNTKFGLPVGVLAVVNAKAIATITFNNKTAVTNEVQINVIPVPTGAAYNKMWIVGDATPNGWNIDNPNEMTLDPDNAFQFKYNAVLNAGEFKIPVTTGNWGTDFFMPLVNHPSLSSTDVQLTRGGNPDNKWEISTAGAYKIVLNISSTPFISIKPFTPYTKLWMVGDATPAGWNIDAPTPMVQTAGNPYEFTYSGPLTAGEFKIPTDTGNWGTDYFMPPVSDGSLADTTVLLIPGGSPDNKWQITVAGNYKITLNQLYETITIQKL